MGKQAEQDVAKIVIFIFAIVMIIAIGRSAGGWAQIIGELFRGTNTLASTLVNAPSA